MALIVLRLDARRGEWVLVADLAAHAGVSCQAIRSACEVARSDGLLLARRADGGAHIDAVRTPDMTAHGLVGSEEA